MPIVFLLFVVAGLVWAAVYALRGSLVTLSLATLVVGYALGHWFWSVDLGPIPLTLDRLLLGGILAVFVVQWRTGRIQIKPLVGVDWLTIAVLGVVTASTLLAAGASEFADAPSPLWRLVASFWSSGILFAVLRHTEIDGRTWCTFAAGLVLVGVYLSLTAVAEVSQQWWAVFPQYISDPNLGTHFGRARGPMLNSASLGLFVSVCFAAAWVLIPHVPRIAQLGLVFALPLMALAVFLSYTRSTWLGLAGATCVLAWLTLPQSWRLPMLGGGIFATALTLAVAWGSILDLKREGATGDSQHSVQQRTAFAYVSWQMFKDHPIAGVGFGRFYDKKLPYLSDRTQQFELESLRPLQHHNTLLSVLTETGMVGFAAVAALVFAVFRHGYRLTRATTAPAWERSHGVLLLATLVAYLPNALFHDITHLHTEIWLVAIIAGVTVAIAQGLTSQRPRARTEGRLQKNWKLVPST